MSFGRIATVQTPSMQVQMYSLCIVYKCTIVVCVHLLLLVDVLSFLIQSYLTCTGIRQSNVLNIGNDITLFLLYNSYMHLCYLRQEFACGNLHETGDAYVGSDYREWDSSVSSPFPPPPLYSFFGFILSLARRIGVSVFLILSRMDISLTLRNFV